MTQSKSAPRAVAARRPTVRNADIPSETVGLPGVGQEASASHFARDMAGRLPGVESDPVGSGGVAGPHAPADLADGIARGGHAHDGKARSGKE